MSRSDGSTAAYYELPKGATELQQLISHRDMNAQIGEIFRACYRYGMASHSDRLRDAKKILFYAQAEVSRLEGTPDDDWYTWYGSPNPPVHPKTRVDVKFTDGYEGSGPAESFQWEKGRGKFSVTRWRVAREDAEQPTKKAAGDWVDCHGAPPWLIGSAKVEVKFRSGSLMTGKTDDFRWTHIGGDSDIVSYREVA